MESLNWVNLDNPVAVWWLFLSLIAALNVTFLFWLGFFLKNKKSDFTKKLFFLTSLYTLGCAYRSFFPKADVQRIALFDTWLSSVFLGRMVATIAEIAFVAQWALILYHYGMFKDDQKVQRIALLVVPLIIIAEIFSWYAVITTNYLGNTIEESLWTICYIFIGTGLFLLHRKLSGYLRLAARIGIIGCVLYVSFMAFVDVPMYFNRFLTDVESSKELLGFWDGLVDLNTRWHVTHDINQWRQEIPWMTLYFSVAVWISLALSLVPEQDDN